MIPLLLSLANCALAVQAVPSFGQDSPRLMRQVVEQSDQFVQTDYFDFSPLNSFGDKLLHRLDVAMVAGEDDDVEDVELQELSIDQERLVDGEWAGSVISWRRESPEADPVVETKYPFESANVSVYPRGPSPPAVFAEARIELPEPNALYAGNYTVRIRTASMSGQVYVTTTISLHAASSCTQPPLAEFSVAQDSAGHECVARVSFACPGAVSPRPAVEAARYIWMNTADDINIIRKMEDFDLTVTELVDDDEGSNMFGVSASYEGHIGGMSDETYFAMNYELLGDVGDKDKYLVDSDKFPQLARSGCTSYADVCSADGPPSAPAPAEVTGLKSGPYDRDLRCRHKKHADAEPFNPCRGPEVTVSAAALADDPRANAELEFRCKDPSCRVVYKDVEGVSEQDLPKVKTFRCHPKTHLWEDSERVGSPTYGQIPSCDCGMNDDDRNGADRIDGFGIALLLCSLAIAKHVLF